jgi:hypothetical protein
LPNASAVALVDIRSSLAAQRPLTTIDRLFSIHSSRAIDHCRKGGRPANPKKPIVRLKIEGDEVMKLKLAAAVLALVVASPAFAAEYYIIQSASSKKCRIVSKKPTSDKATLVGDGAPYNTKKEARTALKAADVCKA